MTLIIFCHHFFKLVSWVKSANSCHSFVKKYEITLCDADMVHSLCTVPLMCNVWEEKWSVWAYLSEFNRSIIHITLSISTAFDTHWGFFVCLFFSHSHQVKLHTAHCRKEQSSPKTTFLVSIEHLQLFKSHHSLGNTSNNSGRVISAEVF